MYSRKYLEFKLKGIEDGETIIPLLELGSRLNLGVIRAPLFPTTFFLLLQLLIVIHCMLLLLRFDNRCHL